jgi:hypothetical protein
MQTHYKAHRYEKDIEVGHNTYDTLGGNCRCGGILDTRCGSVEPCFPGPWNKYHNLRNSPSNMGYQYKNYPGPYLNRSAICRTKDPQIENQKRRLGEN